VALLKILKYLGIEGLLKEAELEKNNDNNEAAKSLFICAFFN